MKTLFQEIKFLALFKSRKELKLCVWGEILLEIPVALWDEALSSPFAQWEQQCFRKEANSP